MARFVCVTKAVQSNLVGYVLEGQIVNADPKAAAKSAHFRKHFRLVDEPKLKTQEIAPPEGAESEGTELEGGQSEGTELEGTELEGGESESDIISNDDNLGLEALGLQD